MYRGKIVDTLNADETTKEMVGLLMAGISPNDARQQTKKQAGKKK
jgi:hypothetical protein